MKRRAFSWLMGGTLAMVNLLLLTSRLPGRRVTLAGSRRAVMALDAATGELIWMHSNIPAAGEFGRDIRLNDSADNVGNTGVSCQGSVDVELGLAYLPVELPIVDVYGGHRPAHGLFGESVVSVDVKTGQSR